LARSRADRRRLQPHRRASSLLCLSGTPARRRRSCPISQMRLGILAEDRNSPRSSRFKAWCEMCLV
jgi:hypothetical protein